MKRGVESLGADPGSQCDAILLTTSIGGRRPLWNCVGLRFQDRHGCRIDCSVAEADVR